MDRVIVVTNKWHDERPSSEAYVVSADGNDDADARTTAIMSMLYSQYLEIERAESAIPIDEGETFCDEENCYAQIAWKNGDVRSYQVVKSMDVPGMDGAEKESAAADDDTPWSGKVLSLSTVHVMPNAVDFLSEGWNSDALQIYPSDGSCVMHISNAKAALTYDIPACVKDCIRYAFRRNYPWIHFGYEDKEQPGLPTYRSAWEKLM